MLGKLDDAEGCWGEKAWKQLRQSHPLAFGHRPIFHMGSMCIVRLPTSRRGTFFQNCSDIYVPAIVVSVRISSTYGCLPTSMMLNDMFGVDAVAVTSVKLAAVLGRATSYVQDRAAIERNWMSQVSRCALE